MTKNREEGKDQLVVAIVEGIQEVKGNNIVILDLTEIPASVTDYFVICDGNSNTQVESIADKIEERTFEVLEQKAWKCEGRSTANWVILDYFNVVVHVFHKEKRELYDLEGLWADAKKKEIAVEL